MDISKKNPGRYFVRVYEIILYDSKVIYDT